MRFIALLRAINVSGRNRVPMAVLKELCADLGWDRVQTYINSGNVVFESRTRASALETALETALSNQFGFTVPVVVRSSSAWKSYLVDNPFREACETEANRVMLGLSKSTAGAGCVEVLRGRAIAGERVVQVGDGLWIHYRNGVAKSKITPALVDRAVGSPVTFRNWRTVVKLAELAGQ